MLNLLKNIVSKYNRVIILGFGREGKSTYRIVRQALPMVSVVIADANLAVIKEPELENDANLQFVVGEDYLLSLTEKAVVFKSPGVVFDRELLHSESLLTSQTDLFLRRFGKRTIGVSGTKGKSTTSSLIYHFLKENNRKTVLLGNIGIPAFDKIEEIDEETWVVFELSAHQLEYVTCSPHIAVLLNVFPEHLDYFSEMEKYAHAKKNLFAFQQKEGLLVLPLSMKTFVDTACSRLITVSADNIASDARLDGAQGLFFKGIKFDHVKWPLKGLHNRLNVLMAISAASETNLEVVKMIKVLPEFRPLPHRLEYLGEHAGITYYNDSISTVPASAMAAVESLDNIGTIILGGYDRGLDYQELVVFLMNSEIESFVFVGKSGMRMMELFDKARKPNLFWFDTFPNAVKKAIAVTKPGKICLLSPASASYDEFHNFEHRGDTFRQLVLTYPKK